MRRNIYTQDHEDFRTMIRDFIESEVVPVFDEWFEAGIAPRDFYLKLGELGLFGIEVPTEYGGEGLRLLQVPGDITEELSRAAVSFGGSERSRRRCACPTFKTLASEDRSGAGCRFITGETMFAIAMTEPGTGSDLAGMRTTARLSEDGTHYVLNGAKTFITGGVHADRMMVCRTAPPREDDDRRFGISLLVVDTKSARATRSAAS